MQAFFPLTQVTAPDRGGWTHRLVTGSGHGIEADIVAPTLGDGTVRAHMLNHFVGKYASLGAFFRAVCVLGTGYL